MASPGVPRFTDDEVRLMEIAAGAGAGGMLLGKGGPLKGTLYAAGLFLVGLKLFGPERGVLPEVPRRLP